MKLNMEKRAYERIATHFFVRFFNVDSLHNGLVTNLSENSIYFISEANLSSEFISEFIIELSIPLKEDDLKVPVKINRIAKTGNLYDGFGAELLSQSQDYIEFVHGLKALL